MIICGGDHELVKGYDADYPFKQQGRWSGDYFDVKGEPCGRWWGSGAAASAWRRAQKSAASHRQVIADHLDPRDGKTRLHAPGWPPRQGRPKPAATVPRRSVSSG